LAEDDEDDVLFFREAVNALSFPCELSVVNDGEHAVNFFLKSNSLPDFIFLDINMPKLNGIEALKAIKSRHPSNDLHVVMLSTSMSESMVEQSYRFGASLYIQKPTNFNDLKEYISYCLNQLPHIAVQPGFILNRNFKDAC
jgi:DNA-binding NarL/FixJ family response regulator